MLLATKRRIKDHVEWMEHPWIGRQERDLTWQTERLLVYQPLRKRPDLTEGEDYLVEETEIDLDEFEDRVVATARWADTVENLKAGKFIELVEGGVVPRDAAKLVGVPLNALVGRREIQVKLQNFLAQYGGWKADIRRELARALPVKVAIEAMEAGDAKMMLDAARLIAADPEVGLASTGALNVSKGLAGILEVAEKDGGEVVKVDDLAVEEEGSRDRPSQSRNH